MTAALPKARLLRDPGHLLALGFGSGLMPKAPGTWGTLVGIVLYLGLCNIPDLYYGFLVILLFFIGISLCGRTAKLLGLHDHPAIVFDEIVGFLVTMAFVEPSTLSVLLGFVLFRLFDILKPWPIGLLDKRVGGGLGIMLDDLLAGVFSLIILEFIKYLSYI